MVQGERPIESEATIAAARAVEDLQRERDRDTITLSSGIVLRLRAVPPLLIATAAARVQDPEPPQVDLGKGRLEANPNDPDYQRDLLRNDILRREVAVRTTLRLGTSVAHVPDGMYGPEAEEWITPLLELGHEVPHANPSERYLSWLHLYACATIQDLAQLVSLPLDLAGLREMEVAAAAATFPGGEERGADPDSPPGEQNPDGNNRASRRARARTAP